MSTTFEHGKMESGLGFLTNRRAAMSFIDFAEVKARCSIEQAAKLPGLQCTEERNQMRAPCPACGNGGPRDIRRDNSAKV
jgi:hypothetical protein